MQIQIIATPPGEMLTCLSFSVPEGEVATIGNTTASKIALPCAASQEKEQYGRIVEEGGQWSLESYAPELFILNHSQDALPRGETKDLNDGDLISCRGYQLMFSNFSPWKPDQPPTSEQESTEVIESLETLAAESGVGSQDPGFLDDPFLVGEPKATPQPRVSSEVHLQLPDEAIQKSAPGLVQGITPGLIDVLADEGFQNEPFEQSETLWSAELQLKQTNRMMAHFPAESDRLPAQPAQEPLPVTSLNEPMNKAILMALEETLKELEPERLMKSMKVTGSWWSGLGPGSAFWKDFVSLYRSRAFSEENQYLFIQRVHQALRNNAFKKTEAGEKVER
ncbi:hypothetical protein [Endozoicomonas arenosclerae]|uniref:hypothetical protein n=1 Tax=Endozoicomonas arenosclerae TaxID=1633495 RepID=UPI0007820E6D|nr:hypothetical protein [Endozoicomonas arenosclerae]